MKQLKIRYNGMRYVVVYGKQDLGTCPISSQDCSNSVFRPEDKVVWFENTLPGRLIGVSFYHDGTPCDAAFIDSK